MTQQWSKFQYAIANPQVCAEIGRAFRDGIPVEQLAAEFEISVSTVPERVERVRCGGAGGGGLAHQVLSSRVAPVRLIISNVPIELTPSAVHASGVITLLRRAGLRIATVTGIERTYHRRRRQAGLGRLTPLEFEAIITTSASQAA